jgi:hypothetical protein
LCLGFFLFGVGLWDKAIFIWTLVGLAVATSAVFPREVFSYLRPRFLLLAFASFCVGSAPLLVFNINYDFVTFRGNAKMSTAGLRNKLPLLRDTFDGSALFGAVMRDDWETPFRAPETSAQKLVYEANELAGGPRRNLFLYACILALLLAPLAPKAVAFSSLFCGITWMEMALTENAGTGVHHTILLWPMPHMAVACTLGALRTKVLRRVAIAVVAIVCMANLAVTNTYYTNTLRNGAVVAWTDAVYAMSDFLSQSGSTSVCVLDWGFQEALRVLHKGHIPVCIIPLPTTPEDTEYMEAQVIKPEHVYVTHVKGLEFFPAYGEEFAKKYRSLGYAPHDEKVFYDFNGRAILRTFRLRQP